MSLFMRITLIVTTYNWPQALRLTLGHIRNQVQLPDEVIIADDGSGPLTAELVKSEALNFPVPLVHSWQEDKGFRAARSRNLAIAKATGDYIILLDGDTMPEKNFIADHRRAARPGFFIQGGRVLLPQELTERMLVGEDRPINLLTPGLGNRKSLLRSRVFSKIFSRATGSNNSIRTCNFALWRDDAININGFNEEFVGWGREDSEFAVRLLGSGIKRLNLRFQAVAFHLCHPAHDRVRLQVNDEMLARVISSRKIRCLNGIDHHLI